MRESNIKITKKNEYSYGDRRYHAKKILVSHKLSQLLYDF